MIVYGALTPHPPLIIPEVGGKQLAEVDSTVRGMKALAQEVAAQKPETLVIITPHGNTFQDAISILALPTLEGNLANFGQPKVGASHPNDIEMLKALATRAADLNFPMVLIDDKQGKYNLNPHLDHGTLVPLRYLEEAGLREVRLLVVSIGLLSLEDIYRCGMMIQEAVEETGRRTAIIASGDMSHRLTQDGPYGFDPNGPVFDKMIKDYLSEGKVLELFDISPSLMEKAGECGFRSIIMLMGALNGISFKSTVYSYEGPMGVGYLIAGFQPEQGQAPDLFHTLTTQKERKLAAIKAQESSLVKWARNCLESYVGQGERAVLPDPLPEELQKEAAAFVSLKKDGQLRGCIGTLQPVRANLGQEILENAISAGTQDYRFSPVTEDELDDLVYSVDVLGKPEPIASMSELDTRKYGVIVRSGGKSGVLLPDLEGIDTPEQQVDIALQKAGIRKGEAYNMERFEVKRYK